MNSKKKKHISDIKLTEVTTRENLISYYNEINETMRVSFGHLKKDPSKVRIKKVIKPILDKWENIFEGTTKKYICEIKIDKTVWQKEV